MNTAVHFSSATDLWETPQEFFDRLDAEFYFGLDACATPDNAKCTLFFSPEQNGLVQKWGGRGAVWCNPPYGRNVGRWVQKASETAKAGDVVVMLLPARTDTAWFHDLIWQKAEVRFVRGRLKFGGCKNAAPFPSMVVVFRPNGGNER